jgi:hypothetical protein
MYVQTRDMRIGARKEYASVDHKTASSDLASRFLIKNIGASTQPASLVSKMNQETQSR